MLRLCLLVTLQFLLCAGSSRSQILENPHGSPAGAYSLDYFQYFGARFNFSAPVTLGSVGGEFQFWQPTTGSFFAAIVPLASMNAMPVGDPVNGIPFNPGEILAYRTFSVSVGPTLQTINVPFSINLLPGVYGVVFGSGLFGTGGIVDMPAYNTVPQSSSFVWSSEPWRWQDTGPNAPFFNAAQNISVTIVPEPSGAVLLSFGLACLLRCRSHKLLSFALAR